MVLNKNIVNLIICYAYKERDLLVYSSHCITISAIATEIRYRRHLDSFSEIFSMISSDTMKAGVSECAEALYQKMKTIPYFSEQADAVSSDHSI
jgi:hypothetical protein